MNMIDKKDPRRESVKFDSSEDEVIIDLTDEIKDKSEMENDVNDLSGETDDDPPIIAKGDKAAEDKEEDEFEEMTGGMDPDALDDDPDEGTGIFDLNDLDDDTEEMTTAMDLGALDDDPNEMTGIFDLNELEDDEPDQMTGIIDPDDLDNDKDEMTMAGDPVDLDDDKDEVTGVMDLNSLDDDEPDQLTGKIDLDDFDDNKDEMTMVTDLDDLDDDKDEVTGVMDLNSLDDDETDQMTGIIDLDDLDGLDDDKDEMTMVTDLDDFEDDKDEMTTATDLDELDDDTDEMTMATDLDDFDDDKDEMTMVTDLDDLDDDKDEMAMVTDLDDLDDDKDEMTMITDLDAFDDDPEELSQTMDLAAFDDDTIIVDNSPDQAEENNSTAVGSPAGETGWNEDLFDLEENVEPEYGLDDEENELIELDEERGEDDHDFADMMLAGSPETNEGAARRAPEKYLDFENEDRDDVIDLESDQDQKAEFISLAEDGTSKFINRDGLPEIEALSDLDFDEEDNEDQETEAHDAASSDDIIARAVERTLSLDDEFRKADLAEEAEFARENDDTLLDLDGSREKDDKILSLADEDHPKSEFVDKLLHLEEQAAIEDDDEVIALDSYGGLNDKDEEEIIEITEFDQHFSADEEITLNQTGMVDPSKTDEDDILELIDVEEDIPFEEKGLIEFSDSPPETGEAEINPVLSDGIDPDFISRQVDPINQVSHQDGTVEIEIALSPVDQVAEEEKKDDTVLEELKVGQAIDELSTRPMGDINAAVEQILNEKLSDRIEEIIYEVIEKAVAKEINRLKRALLGNESIDDLKP